MKSPPAVKNRRALAASQRAGHASLVRPRGRPRSIEARRAILKATHELLAEGGLSSVTIEGIAARAGVGKPTIYRSWPNAHAVAMAALMENGDGTTATPLTAAPAADSGLNALRAQLHEIARVFSAPLGRNVTLMIAAAEKETELSKAFRNHFILARRKEGRMLLEIAMADGEIRNDLDIEVALDLIYAPVFYRLLMGDAPLSPQFTDAIVALALQGFGGPAHAR